MTNTDRVTRLWYEIDGHHWHRLPEYFAPDAVIRWHNTNEQFTVPEFVRANSDYPGNWAAEVERVLTGGDTVCSVVRVWDREGEASFHVTSFFAFQGGLIIALDEYWGEDGAPPAWRTAQRIGKPFR